MPTTRTRARRQGPSQSSLDEVAADDFEERQTVAATLDEAEDGQDLEDEEGMLGTACDCHRMLPVLAYKCTRGGR